jgi:sialic acid synthase SpsE
MHLANITDMRSRFGVPVGLSDHSEGNLAAVVGVSLGACVIEKHVKLDGVDSVDSEFSMTMDDFTQMVSNVRNAKIIAQGPDYGLPAGEKESTVFRRSLFAVRDIAEGETITEEAVRSIRPGYGAAPKYYSQIIGQVAQRNIKRGEPFTMDIGGKVK